MPEGRHQINSYRDVRRKFLSTNPPEFAHSMVANIWIRRIALGMSYAGRCVDMIAGVWSMEMWKLFSPRGSRLGHCNGMIVTSAGVTKKIETPLPNQGHRQDRFYVRANSTKITGCYMRIPFVWPWLCWSRCTVTKPSPVPRVHASCDRYPGLLHRDIGT